MIRQAIVIKISSIVDRLKNSSDFYLIIQTKLTKITFLILQLFGQYLNEVTNYS